MSETGPAGEVVDENAQQLAHYEQKLNICTGCRHFRVDEGNGVMCFRTMEMFAVDLAKSIKSDPRIAKKESGELVTINFDQAGSNTMTKQEALDNIDDTVVALMIGSELCSDELVAARNSGGDFTPPTIAIPAVLNTMLNGLPA